MAGAPCPEELCKAVVDELGMKDFVVAYGMTETSPVTFQGFPDDDMLLKTSTVGYPMDHQEVKVVDGQGKTVAVGEVINIITSRTLLHLFFDRRTARDPKLSQIQILLYNNKLV